MGNTRKLAIGLGLAGGALLTAWLLTGDRARKTRDYLVKRAQALRNNLKNENDNSSDETGIHYL
ncbi:MAG: hypothetical protein AB7K37_05295 [Cyclobacteriaceae bacterium]